MKYKTGEGRGAASSRHSKRQLLEGTRANASRTVSVLSTPWWGEELCSEASKGNTETEAREAERLGVNRRTKWVTKSDLGRQGGGTKDASALSPMCLENPPK